MSKQDPKKPVRYAKKPTRAPQAGKRPGWMLLAGLAVAVALIAASFSLVGRGNQAIAGRIASGPAPNFIGTDVMTNRTVSKSTFRGSNVLLFFSEGVMCQSCLQQIQALQQQAGVLKARGVKLVSITPDDSAMLREAGVADGITTPLIADPSRTISKAYDMLNMPGGMHADTPNHSFVLLDKRGTIIWRHDYQEMWVPVAQLLAALPKTSS